jgi:BioD-like phosphotransacetylase family protein
LVALYVVSAKEAAGKTAICAGLGRYLQANGKKVGYLRPGEAASGDAAFMKEALSLAEDSATLCPPSGDLKKAYDTVAVGKDVVIIEGTAAKDPGGRVIAVEVYGDTGGYAEYDESLLGVIINKVPSSQLQRVREEASARGINILGVLPENRSLLAVTVGELAERLRGRILNDDDKAAELVENYMLGAMVVDSGLDYFGRQSRKAAVIRGDRPDMQLAALETPTSCLVLSGAGEAPIYSVMEKAEGRGIPIIATDSSADDIIASIEDMLAGSRFSQIKKLPRLAEMIQQHLDLKAVA